MAVEAVNDSLRRAAREPLREGEQALLRQLREDGVLLGNDGLPLANDGRARPRQTLRIGGQQVRCFVLSEQALLGDG
jgi:hypothetical protein